MLIGLTGLKQSGKDTIADYLRSDYYFSRYAFADKLKSIAMDLWDLSEAQVNGTAAEKEAIDIRWGKSPRQLMQSLGTEVVRSGHVDTWIKWLHRHRLAHPLNIGADCVITDVRFHNEAGYVRSHGGILIRVVRSEASDGADLHSSESGQWMFGSHYTIQNDKSLIDLHRDVDVIMEKIKQAYG
jgi:hypothetical protein